MASLEVCQVVLQIQIREKPMDSISGPLKPMCVSLLSLVIHSSSATAPRHLRTSAFVWVMLWMAIHLGLQVVDISRQIKNTFCKVFMLSSESFLPQAGEQHPEVYPML